MQSGYKICSRCIMDTSDSKIEFDENGVCNHCKEYDRTIQERIHTDAEGQKKFRQILDDCKAHGKNKKYDCIIGVSGGVDSSYLAYKTKELGLRPLAVHLDNGWNSELAVSNIEKLLTKLQIDLYTHVIDWEEFKDLQVAFLKASTPDSEIPTDHAILAILYEMAAKNGIKYIITGHNAVTEGYGVSEWSQGHRDWKYIKSIHKKFGKVKKLKTFPHYGMWKFFEYHVLKRIQTVPLLNYLPFVKEDAQRLLENEFGWRPYAAKHFESKYTAFYQGYILPKKFGYDKRRCHLSSLVGSGQITRDTALREIQEPSYPADRVAQDKEYVIKKFGLTPDEFEGIMKLPPKSFWDYPSYKNSPLFRNKLVMSVYHWLLEGA